jgi:plastocyanin
LTLFSSYGQIDTSLLLVSKIDAFPQFQLPGGNSIYLMGYSQSIGGPLDIPSPTLNFKEGDSVKLDLWNLSQGPPHTIHLHGLDVNQQNDGVPSLSFDVAHDETKSYYFKAPHPGTYIYHCHETSVLHVQAGMYGMLIVRPQSADTLTWEGGYSFHREYSWMTSEIDESWHADSIINHVYDSTATTHAILDYYPQYFFVNGRTNQQMPGSSAEVTAALGETVYLRLANIGNYGNRIIFPSELNAEVIASDGRPLPSSYLSDTVVVLPGERFGVLLEPSVLMTDSIQIDYFSLNTENIENTQNVPIIIDGYVGVTQLHKFEVLIYPNPVSSTITLKIPQSNNVTKRVTITDMLGKIIKESVITQEEVSINLSSCDSGTYILNVTDGEHKLSKLLIKE